MSNSNNTSIFASTISSASSWIPSVGEEVNVRFDGSLLYSDQKTFKGGVWWIAKVVEVVHIASAIATPPPSPLPSQQQQQVQQQQQQEQTRRNQSGAESESHFDHTQNQQNEEANIQQQQQRAIRVKVRYSGYEGTLGEIEEVDISKLRPAVRPTPFTTTTTTTNLESTHLHRFSTRDSVEVRLDNVWIGATILDTDDQKKRAKVRFESNESVLDDWVSFTQLHYRGEYVNVWYPGIVDNHGKIMRGGCWWMAYIPTTDNNTNNIDATATKDEEEIVCVRYYGSSSSDAIALKRKQLRCPGTIPTTLVKRQEEEEEEASSSSSSSGGTVVAVEPDHYAFKIGDAVDVYIGSTNVWFGAIIIRIDGEYAKLRFDNNDPSLDEWFEMRELHYRGAEYVNVWYDEGLVQVPEGNVFFGGVWWDADLFFAEPDNNNNINNNNNETTAGGDATTNLPMQMQMRRGKRKLHYHGYDCSEDTWVPQQQQEEEKKIKMRKGVVVTPEHEFRVGDKVEVRFTHVWVAGTVVAVVGTGGSEFLNSGSKIRVKFDERAMYPEGWFDPWRLHLCGADPLAQLAAEQQQQQQQLQMASLTTETTTTAATTTTTTTAAAAAATTAAANKARPPPPSAASFLSVSSIRDAIVHEAAASSASSTTSLAEDIASYLVDPISQEVMTDPVVAADGFTYDRRTIEMWLANHNTSPMTNKALPTKVLFPNLAVKGMINKFREKIALQLS